MSFARVSIKIMRWSETEQNESYFENRYKY
jgi:hypothetical protein